MLMTQNLIGNMNVAETQGLLLRVMNREPGLIFDVLQPPAHQEEQQLQDVPRWCSCTRCIEMPSDIEKKCCGMTDSTCVSTCVVIHIG
ncbi:hypothetical protein PO909_002668 [Leuciscus waleckii]